MDGLVLVQMLVLAQILFFGADFVFWRRCWFWRSRRRRTAVRDPNAGGLHLCQEFGVRDAVGACEVLAQPSNYCTTGFICTLEATCWF